MLFNERWLWRQNFLRMPRLSFEWHFATLKDVKRLWKRNFDNRRPFSWFLRPRGLLLFNERWLWRQNFLRMPRLSCEWHFATLKDVKRLWKRIGGNRRPFSWFLRHQGLLLFNERWLWRQNFLRMPRLSCEWHFATLKDVKRLRKRIGGNRRPFSWFLRHRGLLLFNERWLWRQNFLRMPRLSFEWYFATLKDVQRLWKRIGGNRRPFSWFLRPRGLLLFNERWLWRQNFLRMPKLSFEWHFATLKDVKRLWKRIGGNRRPFSWFLRPRGLLLFNERWLWRQNFLRIPRLSFQWHFATLKDEKRLWNWWQSEAF